MKKKNNHTLVSMKTTCLLCDTLFSISAYHTPQTSYLMCPECRDTARAEAKAETPSSVKKKRNRKRGENHQVSQLRKALKAHGIATTAKDIRRAFPTAGDRHKRQVSALRRKERERKA